MEVYLDNSATTKPYDEVVDVVSQTMKEYYANPSSAHTLGFKAEKKITESREKLAKTINCSKDEIIFTSGASESNNFALKGFITKNSHIITTQIEHPSIINTCKNLEKSGVKITYLSVDNKGRIDINELKNSITKDTQLVSIIHVNNEIGTVQDISLIGNMLKKYSNRIKFHVDAVQSYGKYRIDVKKSKIDLLSASAHKIHGPRGVGFIYVRKGLIPIRPLICGGGQEKTFRSGTENLPSIAGFSIASEIAHKYLEDNFSKITNLKQYFIKSLSNIDGIKINNPEVQNFSPYILSVCFKGIRAEILLRLLDENGIYVSMGSACSARDVTKSHVLKAIGLNNEDILGTIRFSFCETNTKEEIDYTIQVLKSNLKFLRRL